MLKKTLLAASVAAICSTSAFAKVIISDNTGSTAADDWTTTQLASVTKPEVLAFSTAEQEARAKFTVEGELKANGFITIQLTGGATFNAPEVRTWLTKNTEKNFGLQVALRQDAADETTVTAPLSTQVAKLFKVNEEVNGVKVVEHSLDLDNTRLRLTLSPVVADAEGLIGFLPDASDALFGAIDTDDNGVISEAEMKTYATAAANQVASFPLYTELSAAAKTAVDALMTTDATAAATDYLLLTDGNAANDGTVTNGGVTTATVFDAIYAADSAAFAKKLGVSQAKVGANTHVDFDFPVANNIFNLKSGSTSSVTLNVGAMRNASYTADPVASRAVFKLGSLFTLTNRATADAADQSVEVEAKVATGFTQTDRGQADILPSFAKLNNVTSNQEIQLNKVNIKLEGDFSGFKVNEAGQFLNATGAATGLVLAKDGTAVTTTGLGDIVTRGGESHDLNSLLTFAIDKDNETPIEAQKMTLSATILGTSQQTFEDYTAKLADLFIITRDGLKFDTILTGTTSANTIHIRDVSGILPVEGGKIFVTVWEYGAHGLHEGASHEPIVTRHELSVKLPNEGAVTLSPASIAADIGFEPAAGRQARMLFEVETNVGEVAVKKQDDKGVDIQTGSQAPRAGKVDFTL
ncbi:TPA: cell surface protein [Vibrio vulnificus]|nr:cell surface protein [Vibrio vulnificus]